MKKKQEDEPIVEAEVVKTEAPKKVKKTKTPKVEEADKKEKKTVLERCKNESRTVIFYEAPHKLNSTLKDMLEYFGDRKISICRELTKIYEEVLRMTISEAVEYYSIKMYRTIFCTVHFYYIIISS